MSNTGVISMGIKAPIIREGDDLKQIVVDSILDATAVYNNGYDFSNDEPFYYDLHDKDVIGITESVVARAQGNYVTIDDIVESITEVAKEKAKGSKTVILYEPIMSRNRFAMILKAFARYADNIIMVHGEDVDQQGNPTWQPNPFTGVDVEKYYNEICVSENCKFQHIRTITDLLESKINDKEPLFVIDAQCHPANILSTTLASFMTYPITRNDGTKSGYNNTWGLLGSNKANEETLKLFPQKDKAQELVDSIQKEIKDRIGVNVEVLVYGDGCFHSPFNGTIGSSINEFADPVTCPAFTHGLDKTPNEIKLKAFADDKYKDLSGKELEQAIKEEIKLKGKELVGNMASQGTTPRQLKDLLASLCDLTSGSGDKGTPIILVKNYFNNYSN